MFGETVKNQKYEIPMADRAAFERLPIPFIIYQFIGGKIEPLLVTDGLIQMANTSRQEFIKHLSRNLMEDIHPDDRETLAEKIRMFSMEGGVYDALYREKLSGASQYCTIHAHGRHYYMEPNKRISFVRYEIIPNENVEPETHSPKITKDPLRALLDTGAAPLAVVLKYSNTLVYFNKPMMHLLKPVVPFNVFLTFNQFFYGSEEAGIKGLLDGMESGGIKVIEEPKSKKKFEITVRPSLWHNSPAHLILIHEVLPENGGGHQGSTGLPKFLYDPSILSGIANKHNIREPGFTGYWIWNLTEDGPQIADESFPDAHRSLGENITYEQYFQWACGQWLDNDSRSVAFKDYSREKILSAVEQGRPIKPVILHSNTEHGEISIKLEFITAKMPETGDVILKMILKNVSEERAVEQLLQTVIGNNLDFSIYIDYKANSCAIILGNDSSGARRTITGPFSEKIKIVQERLERHVSGPAQFVEEILQACAGGTEANKRVTLSGGTIKSILYKIISRENERYFVSCTDVTKILYDETVRSEELNDALDTIQKSNRAKSVYLSTFSSEIRDSLKAVSDLTAIAKEHSANGEDVTGYLDRINEAVSSLGALTNQISDIYAIENRQLKIESRPFNLSALVEQINSLYKPQFRDKGVLWSVQSRIQHKSVLGDAIRLKQILLNLISNSLKFTGSGGHVSLTINEQSMHSDRSRYEFVVEDSGSGMDEETVKLLFMPFTVSDSDKRNFSGSGIGIAITSNLVHLMRGDITARSSPGQGTTITLNLPLSICNEGEKEILGTF